MSVELSGPRFEKPVERRDILGIAAAWSFFGTIAAAVLGSLRLPVPTVFPESSSRFPIGKPEEYQVGTQHHLPRMRIWVIRDEGGIAAVSTICPHLGCLVKRGESGEFTCPCHGSVFNAAGDIVSGPSPRGLRWVEVSLGPDGRLVVDSEREVRAGTRFSV
ncbi:MAG: ubiquinol-cytochrome c reductase iron-sulfur subunit [Planctomycetota bacterium]